MHVEGRQGPRVWQHLAGENAVVRDRELADSAAPLEVRKGLLDAAPPQEQPVTNEISCQAGDIAPRIWTYDTALWFSAVSYTRCIVVGFYDFFFGGGKVDCWIARRVSGKRRFGLERIGQQVSFR